MPFKEIGISILQWFTVSRENRQFKGLGTININLNFNPDILELSNKR